ncbi:AraC family transcriptional regulator [Pedobacter panaciterrae]|uniref:AraC family transcriptional regulator n=1 Tax=Pedobacter panaciterrae TaxID=363849 RepID=UPI00259643BF|nr:AraC family transcriptional regulator [uncultured Pedobacter sp.]
MTHVIPKSPISQSKVYVVKEIYAPYFDPTFHSHPEFQLNCVLEGEGSRFVGNNITSFKAMDMVLIGPHLPHVWRNENKYFEKDSTLSTRVIVVYFHKDFFGEALRLKDEMGQIDRLFQKSERGLEIIGKTKVVVSKMMRELLELDGMDGVIQLLKILNVLAKSNDYHFVTHNYLISSNTEAETTRMNKVYGHVMRNFKHTISAEEVASLINMTRTSFSRYFRARVNKSFSDFLKEIRIESACKLLKEGKMNIDQIGYECGFQTLSNFNKQFKKVIGKQPNQYRNEYQKVAAESYRYF